MADNFIHDTIDAAAKLAAALAPAAFGSAVAQAWKTGLSWRERLIQWIVGILVSYYVTLGLTALVGWNAFVAQAVGFVVAMIAFESAPRFIRAAAEAVGDLPAMLRDKLFRKGNDA